MEIQINTILRYVSKKSFADFLEVSRTKLYSLLEDKDWKEYQKEKIKFVYNEIKSVKGEIIKVKLTEDYLTMSVRVCSKIKSVNLGVILN